MNLQVAIKIPIILKKKTRVVFPKTHTKMISLTMVDKSKRKLEKSNRTIKDILTVLMKILLLRPLIKRLDIKLVMTNLIHMMYCQKAKLKMATGDIIRQVMSII